MNKRLSTALSAIVLLAFAGCAATPEPAPPPPATARRAARPRPHGVHHARAETGIHREGRGAPQPIKDCKGSGKTKELIACLEPNRRVETEAVGSVTK